MRLRDLTTIRAVGQGVSGVVNEVVHEPTGRTMALKVIPLDTVQKETRQQILSELRTLNNSSCPNIVRFFGAFYEKGSISICLEFMQGDLHEVVAHTGPLPDRVLAR